MSMLHKTFTEPYRIFFPLGFAFFMYGICLWIPQIWEAGNYPVILHRYLLLNGFTASFITGFLMTAVPKFSGTFSARKHEVFIYLLITSLGLIPAHMNNDAYAQLFSALQPLVLLYFLISRIRYRKQNPPYSFMFIFAGLLLWSFSAFYGFLIDPEDLKRLHYEGAVAAIILGVGGRLIPGILGHVEIVQKQRAIYEKPVSLLKTAPKHFIIMIFAFCFSYLLSEITGNWIRAIVVTLVAFFYWRIHKLPKERSSLTWSIWTSAWLIVLSFLIRAFWSDGMIHASHSFFINGIALLSFLVATRVLQSHGPQDKNLENKKVLYFVTFMLLLSSSTRVSAYLMSEHYLTHLGYSSLVLTLGAIMWAINYLRYAFVFPKGK